MGCWGLLGWLLLVIMDHSRKFPAFSTSKNIFHAVYVELFQPISIGHMMQCFHTNPWCRCFKKVGKDGCDCFLWMWKRLKSMFKMSSNHAMIVMISFLVYSINFKPRSTECKIVRFLRWTALLQFALLPVEFEPLKVWKMRVCLGDIPKYGHEMPYILKFHVTLW